MEAQSEFVVEGQPQRVLRLIYEYVRTDWPHQGTVVLQPGIGDPNRVVYSEHPPRAMWRNPLGFVLLGILTLLTSGVFLLGYVVWREWGEEKIPGAAVLGYSETPTTTRLTITADKPQYGQDLAAWIRSELVENRAGRPEAPPSSASAEFPSPQASDIPEQIKKLADLRDSGAIAEEEFEAKKAELLDRM